ncbi:MAG: hypothetical protein AAB721_01785 [Patescibacteria group bacterium]
MGPMTLLYVSIGIRLFAAVLPALEEQAKKTPNPADDIAIQMLKEVVGLLNGDMMQTILKVK